MHTANARMDDLKNTVTEYGEKLILFNRKLQQAKERKAYLQEKLLRERKQTSQLRAQVEALKGKKKELEERERCQALTAKNLEVQVESASNELDLKIQQETVLRNLIETKLSDIERASQDIFFKFQKLRLRNDDDPSYEQEGEEDSQVSQEMAQLETQIMELEEEKEALLLQMDNDPLPVDELRMIIGQTETGLSALKDRRSLMEEKITKLVADIEQFRYK